MIYARRTGRLRPVYITWSFDGKYDHYKLASEPNTVSEGLV